MKQVFLAIVLCLTLGAGSAQAQLFWTGSVNDGFGNWAENVQTFDWASSGSGVAIGLGAGPLVEGTEFTFLYQARLAGLADPAGQAVDFPNLNSTFEYTFVAVVPERVVEVSADGRTAILETLAGGSWYMFWDAPPNSVTETGFGFQDGTLVAEGTWLAGYETIFRASADFTSGIGGFVIEGLRGAGTIVNPDFLDPTLYGPNDDQLIFDIRLEGQTNIPALDSTTTTFFAGDGPLAAYTVTANDLLFKVDASSKFSVIPEPSTVILLGLGLLGLAGYSRKKLRK
ncbi:flocculation-associated PEP-CTERM protein PepA [Geoalkalibacter halelectricus]|uniref:Flocculation-associated PEP-CTERM protein PepA n=1 Tax=Geoalkalibacter halelectricus TaxID=2847045 RepID=A0ABY5ZH60_9BACT|nr:flocculation-associated PEP-CTERM protein PepA [Geoalkalibacter halelectricus]MDO3379690.1 flocculation-associated PEP-CTERM protein PepA [Geoalkalibacter halelectricus]UWZ78495.1 flocculation-associated PEP-CTERM protein PepA [Geoalkalibacter halelectricus]